MADYHERLFDTVKDAYAAEIDRRDRILTSLRLSLAASGLLFGGVAFVFDRVAGIAPGTLRDSNLKVACLFLLGITALLLFASVVNFLFSLLDQEALVVDAKSMYDDGVVIREQAESAGDASKADLSFLLHAGRVCASAAGINARRNDRVIDRRRAGFLMLLVAIYTLFPAIVIAVVL